jgi:hypothetical protein
LRRGWRHRRDLRFTRRGQAGVVGGAGDGYADKRSENEQQRRAEKGCHGDPVDVGDHGTP